MIKASINKSQTFIQEKTITVIPDEFKLKMKELVKIGANKVQGLKEPRENAYALLPSLGENWYGYNLKKLELEINFKVLINYIILLTLAYSLARVCGGSIGCLLLIIIYLVLDLNLFEKGFAFIDANTPTTTYKRVSTIPASANIIYEVLSTGTDLYKYDLMMKKDVFQIQRNTFTQNNIIVPKENNQASSCYDKNEVSHAEFELPEAFPYKSMYTKRVCYTNQFHGVGENGVSYIINKKIPPLHPIHMSEVEMEKYEESFIIIPISGAESKVIFISQFDYGGKVPVFFKNKIAAERLNHLECIKSYFQDKNQEKVYETLRKGTEIVEEIQKNSLKELNQIEIESEEVAYYGNEEVKHLEHLSEEEAIPDEDSADAGADIDEASEIQSFSENYRDWTSNFMKSNPFIQDKVRRNTMNVKPSYLQKKKEHKNKMMKSDDVEIIYEEVEGDF